MARQGSDFLNCPMENLVKCLFLLPYLMEASGKDVLVSALGPLFKFHPKYYITLQQIFIKCKAIQKFFLQQYLFSWLKQSIHVNYLCLLLLMAVKQYYKIQVIIEVCCTEHCKDLYKTIVSIRKLFSIYSHLTV